MGSYNKIDDTNGATALNESSNSDESNASFLRSSGGYLQASVNPPTLGIRLQKTMLREMNPPYLQDPSLPPSLKTFMRKYRAKHKKKNHRVKYP